MRIVPAVDILDGVCVNLVQGDYEQGTVFSDDPVAQGKAWHGCGAELIHIVDLNGAKEGRCCIERELEAFRDEGVPVEVGGGIRNPETVDRLLELGVKRVILGTAAHNDPDFLHDMAVARPDSVVVGVDARDGKVAVEGWLDMTDTDAVEFACAVEASGAKRIIYTDILRDGMMEGPNLEMIRRVAQAVSVPITASGGIAKLEDVHALKKLEGDGVDEIIIGRALYLQAFSLEDAIAAAREV